MSVPLNDTTSDSRSVHIVAMDVDNTLLRGQSQAHFARTLHQYKLIPFSKSLLVYWWYLKHRLGWRPANPTYYQNAILGIMAGLPTSRLDAAFRACATEMLQPRLRPDAIAAIQAWRADGAKVILVSASLEPLIRHLVEMVGADGIVATRIVESGDVFSGIVDGDMVIGELKWERLSVRDNILVGRPDSTEQEIVEAARAAHIHDTVMSKPDRYDMIVSVTGGALSGGERQRVATARALLRDAPILLLDEATSALDPASEQVVNQSIARRVGRNTVVSVTHRLSSITEFDRIFVMDGGRLVESGRHEELLAKRGLYCDLWEKQNGINLDIENGAPSVSAERLALIPFLSGCSAKTLADLASMFVVEAFREGSDVFRQGDNGDKFYIVARGRLEVRMDRPSEGEVVVATLVDGDFFGELALVKNQPRAATIHVVSDSWCLSLPRQHFLALLKTEEAVRANIVAAIAKIDAG